MKTSAMICFVLAVVSAIPAINNVSGAAGRRDAADLTGYAVGSFLLPVAFLIGGLYLAKKK